MSCAMVGIKFNCYSYAHVCYACRTPAQHSTCANPQVTTTLASIHACVQHSLTKEWPMGSEHSNVPLQKRGSCPFLWPNMGTLKNASGNHFCGQKWAERKMSGACFTFPKWDRRGARRGPK